MFDEILSCRTGNRATMRKAARVAGSEPETAPARGRKLVRDAGTDAFKGVAVEVMKKAKASGLLNEKDSRITGRVSRALIEQAKRRTGITENTELIEFALASVALEDNFAEAFKSVRGAVDPEIKLGF
jgi:hypothetical protein